jgi:hypothetical protein
LGRVGNGAPSLPERSMKQITSILLAIIFALSIVLNVNAQSAETIWLSATTTSYKTQETVITTVNAVSGTPIQGFTFQIRYDPACLQPVGATSPIPGMNGLSLPQTPGLVDATFASTTPQTAGGVIAEVRFLTLGGCQTNLVLESAALAIRNADGFAAPLPGVAVGANNNVALNIDKAIGNSQVAAPVAGGTPLPLGNEPVVPSNKQDLSFWLIIGFLGVVVAGGIIITIRLLRKPAPTPQQISDANHIATISMQQGSMSGQKFQLTKLPCRIGRSPFNEICLNDPNVSDEHARIFINNNIFYLMDLGGETIVNDTILRKSSAPLKPGDKVRLGQGVLFVFGY